MLLWEFTPRGDHALKYHFYALSVILASILYHIYALRFLRMERYIFYGVYCNKIVVSPEGGGCFRSNYHSQYKTECRVTLIQFYMTIHIHIQF